jgi:hypothetical protein
MPASDPIFDGPLADLVAFPGVLRAKAAARREDAATDPVADNMERTAERLDELLERARARTRRLTPAEYGALPHVDVTAQTVRTWCRDGELPDARLTPHGWEIPADAVRARAVPKPVKPRRPRRRGRVSDAPRRRRGRARIRPTDTLLGDGQQLVGQKPHHVVVYANAERRGVLYLKWRAAGNWAYESLRVPLPDPAPAKASRPRATRPSARGRTPPRPPCAARSPSTPSSPATGRAGGRVPPDPAAEAERARLAAQAAFTVGAGPRARHRARGRGGSRPTRPTRATCSPGGTGRSRCGGPPPASPRSGATTGSGSGAASSPASAPATRRTASAGRARTPGSPARGPRSSAPSACSTPSRPPTRSPRRPRPRPREWQKALARDFAELHGGGETPERHRPRFTADELRALHRAARRPATDPRVRLAMALGAELRPAQVLRLTRRALALPTPPTAADYGRCVVKGRGTKGGVVLDLTRQQRAEVDAALDPARGYLRELEAAYGAGALADYLLFQAGRLATGAAQPPVGAGPTPRPARYQTTARDGAPRPRRAAGTCPQVLPLACATSPATAGRTMSDTTLRTQFLAVQVAAGITPVRRRAWYGQRRGTVDAADARNVSAGTLQQLGGWSNPETPLGIYKDRANAADRRAARDARAAIRGEDAADDEGAGRRRGHGRRAGFPGFPRRAAGRRPGKT